MTITFDSIINKRDFSAPETILAIANGKIVGNAKWYPNMQRFLCTWKATGEQVEVHAAQAARDWLLMKAQ